MNPYQVLGVAPASMDEIEAAYRQQVRAHHPDLHQGEPADALAEAEATTRTLNEAMALVRAGWRPLPGSAAGFHYDDRTWGSGGASRSGSTAGGDHGQSSWNSSFATDPDKDWFGNPLGPRRAEAVDCPICGQVFTDPLKFRSHLQRSHHIADADGVKPRRRS
jgi:curved DNA-binding protein CbpA